MPTASRTRVLHVIPWVTSGGVERRRLELARALDPTHFEQRVICLEARETLRADFERAGVPVISIGGSGSVLDYRSIWRVTQEARAFAPDVIHGAVFEGVTLASLAGRLARVPRVVIEEISDGENRSKRAQALFRLYALLSDECIAVSHYAKQQLVDTGIPERRIRVIVNGVSAPNLPSEAGRAELRAEWNIGEGDLVVCTIGRLHNEHKRLTDLIEAVALAQRSDARLKLLIVGGGNERPALEQHAERQGIAERVTFTGYQTDVGLALSVADVFALASARESFGLVAVEAMLAGLPVVATSVGGLREIVADGETGYLVPPFAPDRFAQALLELCASAELRRRMGDAGRVRGEARFSAQRYVEQVADLYRSLAAVGPSRHT
jgi:L-malate glycosyltransferase